MIIDSVWSSRQVAVSVLAQRERQRHPDMQTGQADKYFVVYLSQENHRHLLCWYEYSKIDIIMEGQSTERDTNRGRNFHNITESI